jgi:hypothetical protein
MSQPIRPIDESEFGGAPGLIQPPPHELTPAEQMTLIKNTDSNDPDSSAEEVRLNGPYGRLS